MDESVLDLGELLSATRVASLLAEAGIRPSKRLGQNFLVDRTVLGAILAEARAGSPEAVLEVGAGLGTVTRGLAGLSRRVVAIEVDPRVGALLRQTVGRLSNVEICLEDVLSVIPARTFGGRPALVVGSIPYSITAPILNWLVDQRRDLLGAVLLTQAEVARKVAASPGPDGTALGVRIKAYADVALVRRVPRSCFWPRPEVDSLLWRLRFLSQPRFLSPEAAFFSLVRTVYGKRRKMIRAALRDLVPAEAAAAALASAGIEPTVRGETLSLSELDRLAGVLAASGTG